MNKKKIVITLFITIFLIILIIFGAFKVIQHKLTLVQNENYEIMIVGISKSSKSSKSNLSNSKKVSVEYTIKVNNKTDMPLGITNKDGYTIVDGNQLDPYGFNVIVEPNDSNYFTLCWDNNNGYIYKIGDVKNIEVVLLIYDLTYNNTTILSEERLNIN